MARRIELADAIAVSHVHVEDAATASSLTAVAADANKIPHLHGLILATDLAGTYTVKIGTTTVLKVYLAENSGYAETFHPFFLSNDAVNEAIRVEKPSGAHTSVTAFYTLEPAL